MNEQKVQQMIVAELDKRAQANQYGVNRVPVHIHNNIDSPQIHSNDIGWLSINLVTASTVGFIFTPNCAGTPTGVPVIGTGLGAMVYDSTNNRLFVYNGAWKGIDLGSGLAGSKVYYVSDTSGGAVTRKLTFVNGILTAET